MAEQIIPCSSCSGTGWTPYQQRCGACLGRRMVVIGAPIDQDRWAWNHFDEDDDEPAASGVAPTPKGWPADKDAEPVPLPKLPPAIVMHPKLGELFDRLAMHTYAMGYAMACANAGVSGTSHQTFSPSDAAEGKP